MFSVAGARQSNFGRHVSLGSRRGSRPEKVHPREILKQLARLCDLRRGGRLEASDLRRYDGSRLLLRGWIMATQSIEERTHLTGGSRRHRPHLYDVLFSRHAAWFAVTCLALSCLLPPDGLGVGICWFKSCFGHPCPGCGLTRSITCLSHCEFSKAWHYHPFGPILYVLFVANAVLLVVPHTMRHRWKKLLQQHHSSLRAIYMALVFAFLAFGCWRLLNSLDLASVWPSRFTRTHHHTQTQGIDAAAGPRVLSEYRRPLESGQQVSSLTDYCRLAIQPSSSFLFRRKGSCTWDPC